MADSEKSLSEHFWARALIVGVIVNLIALTAIVVALIMHMRQAVTTQPQPSPLTQTTAPDQIQSAPVSVTPVTATPTPPLSTEQEFRRVMGFAAQSISDGNYNDALTMMQDFSAKFIGDPWADRMLLEINRVRWERAEALFKAEKFDEAQESFTQLADDPRGGDWAARARERLALALRKRAERAAAGKDWNVAERCLRMILRDYSKSYAADEAREQLAQLFLDAASDAEQRAAPADAVRYLRMALDEFPDSSAAKQAQARIPRAQVLWGALLMGAREYDRAIELFESVQKNAPNAYTSDAKAAIEGQAETLCRWALELAQEYKYREAFEKADMLSSKRFADSQWRAALLKGDFNEARRVFRELRSHNGQDPTPPQLLFALMQDQLQRQMREESIATARRLIKDHPDSREAAEAGETVASRLYADAIAQRANDAGKSLAQLRQISAEFPETTAGKAAVREATLIAATPADMVYVPAGEFKMGADLGELTQLGAEYHLLPAVVQAQYGFETPAHIVNVAAFYIDRCEVTNAQYKKFIDAENQPPPPSSAWNGKELIAGMEDQPVVGVTWFEAERYAKWAGKRLPSEAEWEKAARGEDQRRYPWGNDYDPTRANTQGSGNDGPVAVGIYIESASPYGALDMVGNVEEWTAAAAAPYPENNGPRPDPQKRIVRGGAWTEGGMDATVTVRAPYDPITRVPTIGFRCAVSADQVIK